jgi:hypothetical protein
MKKEKERGVGARGTSNDLKYETKIGVCISGPPIKLMSIKAEGEVNKLSYGYDWEGICLQCGKKYNDH